MNFKNIQRIQFSSNSRNLNGLNVLIKHEIQNF